jgi:hypothetical protein
MSDPSVLVKREQKALIAAIKDAQKKEKIRQKWMDKARTPQRKSELLERYNIERSADQEHIKRLVNDFDALKHGVRSGVYDSISKQRSILRENKAVPIKTMHLNKFAKAESHEDMQFIKGRINKFDKLDYRADRKLNSKPYDEYGEKRRLKLLYEKRDVLQSLVGLQSNGAQSRGIINNGGMNTSRSDTSSVASMATFASRSSRPSYTQSHRPQKVPTLRLQQSS